MTRIYAALLKWYVLHIRPTCWQPSGNPGKTVVSVHALDPRFVLYTTYYFHPVTMKMYLSHTRIVDWHNNTNRLVIFGEGGEGVLVA